MDNKQALYWFKLSAEQGNSSAQNNLGAFYENGIGTEANLQEAMKWYRKYLTHPEISLTAFINIALMYDQRGKRAFARRYAKKALKIMGKKKQDKGSEALKERLKKLALGY